MVTCLTSGRRSAAVDRHGVIRWLYSSRTFRRLAHGPNLQSGCAVTTPRYSCTTIRAPALYVSGFVDREADGATVPFAFRLPCPPAWDDRLPGAWAAERRARRAYFATLDALRTGAVDPVETAKIERLIGDLRSHTARTALLHFQRVLEFVGRLGRSAVPAPTEPMTAVVIGAPPVPAASTRPVDLATRYRWALEWLSTRRFVASKGLRVEWRVRRATPAAGMQAVNGGTAGPGNERR